MSHNSNAHIADSGERREFDSGAVRDIAEGKGRMDLLPLRDISEFLQYFKNAMNAGLPISEFSLSFLYSCMDDFLVTNDCTYLYAILMSVIKRHYNASVVSAMLDLSIHYEEGAKKYCERNWEKGIPCHCYVDSALRHGTKLCRQDKDEPHDRALMWNIFGLLWTLRNKPELNDLPNSGKKL